MKLPLRRLIFWAHLAIGCSAAVVVAIMAATGVLLAFEPQLVAWAERGVRSSPAGEGASPGLELALARAADTIGRPATAVTLAADPSAPLVVSFGQDRTVLVDASTGAVLAPGSNMRAAMRTVTAWHRWLGASGDQRELGGAVTGACNLAFLVLVVTGLYLWVPQAWTAAALRATTRFRRGLSGKARDFNWHNVFGLWAALPLLLVVASGVVISYDWAGDLVFRLAGSEPPARRSGGGSPGGARVEEPAAGYPLAGLDVLAAAARSRVDGWRTITARLADDPTAPVAFTILSGPRGRPDLRAQLTLARDGSVERWQPYEALDSGQKARSWLRWIHTGEAGGIPGQTVAGLAALASVLLAWTGVSLALRRLGSYLRRGRTRLSTRDSQ
jgi:uncharacterized iron-regulated membrane protein